MTLVLTIACAVFLISLWRREYGLALCLILLPSYLLRTTIAGIPTTALELSIYAVVLAWILRAAIIRKVVWPQLPRPFIVLLGVWVFAWVLATWLSTDRQASLGALKAWLIDPLLFGLVLCSTVTTTKHRAVLLMSTAISGSLVAIFGLFEYFFHHETLQDGRLSSFFHPVANYAAMFLAPIIVVTVGAILWKVLHRWWWTAVAVMFVALALTVSFGGYLSVAVGLLVLWWRWPNRRQQRTFLIAALVVMAVSLGILTKTPYLAEKFNTTDRSSSLVRTQIWRTSVEMIRERPWFGVGPNAYETIYRETIPKLYWPPLEWLVAQPHQLGLALWLETGLLGLLAFVAVMGWWMRSLWARLLSREPIAVVAVAAMTAIIVHGFVDTPLFKNDLMVLFTLVTLLPLLSVDKNKLTY